jgi:hypothetical protein
MIAISSDSSGCGLTCKGLTKGLGIHVNARSSSASMSVASAAPIANPTAMPSFLKRTGCHSARAGHWGAPWVNLKLGIQYTLYTQFNGGTNNYDGFGRNASGNNTLLLFALARRWASRNVSVGWVW